MSDQDRNPTRRHLLHLGVLVGAAAVLAVPLETLTGVGSTAQANPDEALATTPPHTISSSRVDIVTPPAGGAPRSTTGRQARPPLVEHAAASRHHPSDRAGVGTHLGPPDPATGRLPGSQPEHALPAQRDHADDRRRAASGVDAEVPAAAGPSRCAGHLLRDRPAGAAVSALGEGRGPRRAQHRQPHVAHPLNLPQLRPARIRRELEDTTDAIVRATGLRPRQFRAPGGVWGPDVYAEVSRQQMMPLGWDIDPRDWSLLGVAHIRSAMLAARPHDIVLCHDGGGTRAQTYAALATVIPALLARGWHFVALPAPQRL